MRTGVCESGCSGRDGICCCFCSSIVRVAIQSLSELWSCSLRTAGCSASSTDSVGCIGPTACDCRYDRQAASASSGLGGGIGAPASCNARPVKGTDATPKKLYRHTTFGSMREGMEDRSKRSEHSAGFEEQLELTWCIHS
jgi:hypothetical protein